MKVKLVLQPGNISLVERRMDSIKEQKTLEANITASVKRLRMKRGGFCNRKMILNP